MTTLSAREQSIKSLILKGCSTNEISLATGIAPDKCKIHIKAVLTHEGADTKLILLAMENERLQERIDELTKGVAPIPDNGRIHIYSGARPDHA
jgi:DNA-binding CsgD family transcriptional regulator